MLWLLCLSELDKEVGLMVETVLDDTAHDWLLLWVAVPSTADWHGCARPVRTSMSHRARSCLYFVSHVLLRRLPFLLQAFIYKELTSLAMKDSKERYCRRATPPMH